MSRNSTKEPGQPCTSSSGTTLLPGAAGRGLTCRKWMSRPAILVTNWGKVLSSASCCRQEYVLFQ